MLPQVLRIAQLSQPWAVSLQERLKNVCVSLPLRLKSRLYLLQKVYQCNRRSDHKSLISSGKRKQVSHNNPDSLTSSVQSLTCTVVFYFCPLLGSFPVVTSSRFWLFCLMFKNLWSTSVSFGRHFLMMMTRLLMANVLDFLKCRRTSFPLFFPWRITFAICLPIKKCQALGGYCCWT